MKTIINKKENTYNVDVKGRLSTDEAEGFLKDIEPLMKDNGVTIVMNLSELEFISSAGIRCFIMLLKGCQAKGSKLILQSLTPQIENIFKLTALLDKFEIE